MSIWTLVYKGDTWKVLILNKYYWKIWCEEIEKCQGLKANKMSGWQSFFVWLKTSWFFWVFLWFFCMMHALTFCRRQVTDECADHRPVKPGHGYRRHRMVCWSLLAAFVWSPYSFSSKIATSSTSYFFFIKIISYTKILFHGLLDIWEKYLPLSFYI